MSLVELEGVTFRRGGYEILSDITWRIEHGEHSIPGINAPRIPQSASLAPRTAPQPQATAIGSIDPLDPIVAKLDDHKAPITK